MADQQEIKVTEHIFVPHHAILGEKEATELLQRYNVSKRQIPKIEADDPAIKHLNPKSGDIIKIVRKSPIDNKAVFYRVVIG